MPVSVNPSFVGTNLTGANWAGQDLDHCDFREAQLTGASFAACILCHTDFRPADLRGAVLTSVPCHADFPGAQLQGARLPGSLYLQGAKIFQSQVLLLLGGELQPDQVSVMKICEDSPGR